MQTLKRISRDEYVVTGDHHLLQTGQPGGTKISEPCAFLKIKLAPKEPVVVTNGPGSGDC
jgi:hypothetical protein